MKKDNLERCVRDNREAFDDKEPTNDLWLKIEAGLDKQVPDKSNPFRAVHKNRGQSSGQQIGWPILNWRVAASIAVLLLAGCFYYINHQYGVAQQPLLVATSPGYAREVVQYTRLIDDKRAELKQMTENNPDLYQEFSADLNRLEKSYRSLKADFPKNPNQEVLIQAMIQNLQFQINLLNEQLRVIQRIKQQLNETNPV
jgi:hypothetical protein